MFTSSASSASVVQRMRYDGTDVQLFSKNNKSFYYQQRQQQQQRQQRQQQRRLLLLRRGNSILVRAAKNSKKYIFNRLFRNFCSSSRVFIIGERKSSRVRS
jgi:hypothetical protein